MQPAVIIIGAGIIGCAVARELARRSVTVVVLERGEAPAAEASGASLGCLNYSPGTENPPAWHALASRALASHHRLEAALKQELESPPTWRWDGRLNLATSVEAERSVRARFKDDVAHGLPAKWFDKNKLHELEPELGGRVVSASRNNDSGWVHPPELTDALAAAAKAAGAHFEFQCEVNKLIVNGSRVDGVLTSGGERRSGATIVCAGAWSSRLDPAGIVDVFPIRGQTVTINTDGAPPFRHVLYGRGVYLVPWKESFSIGSTHEQGEDQRGNTVAGVSKLLSNGITLLPAVGAADWSRVQFFSGVRPATRCKTPFIGPDPRHEGLWWATGHMYHGILLSALTGELIAEGIAENKPSDLWTMNGV